MNDLRIEYVETAHLRPYTRNARTHSKKQIGQIKESIRVFGFTNPVLIDDELTILAGHGRVAAAKQLRMERVPCVRLSSMTPAQKRAYVLADNKLALNAGWDEEILRIELQGLTECALDFDIAVTGFSIAELDTILESGPREEPGDPADDILPDLDSMAPVTRPGDMWLLGPHRLYCGDSLEAASFEALLGSERAQMVFVDPPYNVPIDGNVTTRSGKHRHREFAMASGEMSRPEFEGFLATAFRHLVRFSADGSIHFVCMDWRHVGEVLAAGGATYSELKNICVWVKDNGGMGTFYRSRHEMVFAFKAGTAPHINSFELGQHGRYRTNVWHYRGMNSFDTGRQQALALHPTVKPVALRG